ncbi:MAG TPA: anthranilate phosphoribosyltransferase [Actinomycetota bacterium]|nr:anthranilate phosphoribosyltransferase [Actinomycetota bacterium]
MEEDLSWPNVLTTLLAKRPLDEGVAAAAMRDIMEGVATPAQVGAFVVALRAKGETVDEIAGLVRTMRAYSARVPVAGPLLDTCGTGGDRSGTFNVSTAAALVCAAAGARVAKHGNRAASSRCGSADVLEALGVVIDLPPEGVASCIEEAGIGFCFAPIFHPAMRHAAVPRRELGIPTVFNFLGPLTNPAGATRQAVGASDLPMLEKMVEVLARLGSERVIGFHGHGGIDELSTSGPSTVVELKDGNIDRWTIGPEDLGFDVVPLEELRGGSAGENAHLIRSLFDGEAGPRRDVVLLNAAAGLLAAGVVSGMEQGVGRAADALDSGAAAATLDRMITASAAAAR